VNVDLDGTNSFLGVSELVSAAGGNSFYGPGYRYTGGTLNVEAGTFGTDGTFEQVLKTNDTLDGQKWTNVQLVDGQGDDVALLVRLADGSQAIYAAIAATVAPPPSPVLTVPSLAGGIVKFRFASAVGKRYRVEFNGNLATSTWTGRGEFAGTGTDLEFSEPTTGAGFYRVVLLP
jgi:hypothetical protein